MTERGIPILSIHLHFWCDLLKNVGQRSYVRPQLKDPSKQDSEEQERLKLKEEIKALRFTHHRTSFDVDIEALEQHPWRKSFANLSDYFNYGFDEDSWRVSLIFPSKLYLKF